MATHRYEKLPGTNSEQDSSAVKRPLAPTKSAWPYISFFLGLALAVSLSINVMQHSRLLTRLHTTGLDQTLHHRFMGYWQETYTSHNSTEQSEAWDAINLGAGVVAMDKTWARERNIPPSREWKPDRTKEVFLLAAYHALHCVPYLRRTIHQLRDGLDLSEAQAEHTAHCLDVLRAELMCTADDTLLATPLGPKINGNVPPIGINQTRQCRDFKAISNWAFENTACYLTVEDHPNATTYWENCHPDGWII